LNCRFVSIYHMNYMFINMTRPGIYVSRAKICSALVLRNDVELHTCGALSKTFAHFLIAHDY
jgi:hypothetical protein